MRGWRKPEESLLANQPIYNHSLESGMISIVQRSKWIIRTGKKTSKDGLASLIFLKDILQKDLFPPLCLNFILKELEKIGIVFSLSKVRRVFCPAFLELLDDARVSVHGFDLIRVVFGIGLLESAGGCTGGVESEEHMNNLKSFVNFLFKFSSHGQMFKLKMHFHGIGDEGEERARKWQHKRT